MHEIATGCRKAKERSKAFVVSDWRHQCHLCKSNREQKKERSKLKRYKFSEHLSLKFYTKIIIRPSKAKIKKRFS